MVFLVPVDYRLHSRTFMSLIKQLNLFLINIFSPRPFVEILLHPSSDEAIENNKLIKLNMKAFFPANVSV